jgi:hypothetical protein
MVTIRTEEGGSSVQRPAGALRDEELQPAREGEHHRDDVLRHHRPGNTLHVGEQHRTFAQRGHGDTVLDPGPEHLHPPDPGPRREHLFRAKADDGVGLSREPDRLRLVRCRYQVDPWRGRLQSG